MTDTLSERKIRPRREAMVWVVGVIWLVAIGGAIFAWERFETTAGAARAGEIAQPSAGRWQLTVYVHPHCPCARATMSELAEVVRHVPVLSVRIVFVLPDGTSEGWEHGELWQLASAMPGAELVIDSMGTEARRMGAETSGHAVLTSPDGNVVFHGGMTRARGRSGESVGRQAVRNWIAGLPAVESAPVYGCPLFATNE